jgi:hypothetical protein
MQSWYVALTSFALLYHMVVGCCGTHAHACATVHGVQIIEHSHGFDGCVNAHHRSIEPDTHDSPASETETPTPFPHTHCVETACSATLINGYFIAKPSHLKFFGTPVVNTVIFTSRNTAPYSVGNVARSPDKPIYVKWHCFIS